MNTFPHIPANKLSLSKRRPLCGVGINDAKYLTMASVDGKIERCPFYSVWRRMLRRCYSPAYHKSRPTYADCTVVDGWRVFSDFKAWMVTQDWEGKQLDKDIIDYGNKVYSPDKCMFVPLEINSLLNEQCSTRGRYPRGVCFDKRLGQYKASISIYGKSRHIGMFDTPDEAKLAYDLSKISYVRHVAQSQTEIIKCALLRAADRMDRSL